MTGIKPGIHNILKVLSPSQIREIHKATMTILEKVGVVFEEEKALELFRDAGAKVTNDVVRLPPEMVENLLKRCPSKVTLYAKDPQKRGPSLGKPLFQTDSYGIFLV